MAKDDKRTFVKGAFILGASGLICKVIGAFFRIPLYNMLGDGMQYYEAVYPYYSTLLVISTAGLPTAISRMVAERVTMGDISGARRVFRKSLVLLLIIGLLTAVLMYFGADFLARDRGQFVDLGANLALGHRQAGALEVAGDLAEDVLVARLLEICAHHGGGVLIRAFARQAHLFRSPKAQHPVAPGDGLELLLLIEGELGFESLFPIVEGRHVAQHVPHPAKLRGKRRL